MEIISTRKVGKRISPSRVFTEYIGNETRASSLNALGMRMGLAYRSKYSRNSWPGRSGSGNGSWVES